MKKIYFCTLLVFGLSLSGFAQKEKIADAQIELTKGNAEVSLQILNSIEYLIINAKEEDKSDFYFLKAKSYIALAKKKIDAPKNMALAVACYKEILVFEIDSNKFKYAVQARQGIIDLKNELEISAATDNNARNFSESANKMVCLYEMDNKDTVQLYNAASNYFNAKQYDLALKNYELLKSLKYTGNALEYYAVNKNTNQEELFSSLRKRDLSVKDGSHIEPRNTKASSKKVEILKKIAFLYAEKGDLTNAEINYKTLVDLNPNDVDNYIDLASIVLDRKKDISSKMSMLGTSVEDAKQYDVLKNQKDDLVKSAVVYLEKALKLDPSNSDVSKLLMNLYRALDMMDKYEALKTKS
jgi:tetratricopeptide (TPR) repeat protein